MRLVRSFPSGSSGTGSNPGRVRYVVFLGKTLTVALFTQVYKWAAAN